MSRGRARPARTVTLFIAANVLYWIALYLYVPTLSTYVGLRTPDLALVGLVLSMYGLWQTFVRLPVGIAVDATGNGKPFIVAGFVLAALGAATLGWSRSVAGLAVGRGLTGFAAATWVPLLAIFSGFFPPERAVLAATVLNLSGSVGRLLATSLNGVLNEAGGYGLAFALAVAASLAAIVIVLVLPVARRPPRRPSLSGVLALARRREVVLPTVLQTLLVFGEWAVPLSFMPLLASELGGGDITKGLLVSVSMASNTLSNVANTWLERRLSHTFLVRLSFGMLVAGVALAAAAPVVGVLFPASALMGFGTGLGYPMLVGLMLRRVEQSERNTATGLHQSVYAVGMFAGPWLGGIIAAAAGLRAMFAVVAAITLAASWLLTRLLAAAMRTAAAGRPPAPAR
jgi:MFS family permease